MAEHTMSSQQHRAHPNEIKKEPSVRQKKVDKENNIPAKQSMPAPANDKQL